MSLPETMTCVVSRGRPTNVGPMTHHVGHDALWVVPKGEGGEYRLAGAQNVAEVASSQVTHQRNEALRIAAKWGVVCVMTDDDLKYLKHTLFCDDYGDPTTMEFDQAVRWMLQEMLSRGGHFGGLGPTNNAYFVKHPVQRRHFIRNNLVIHTRPGDDQYDDNLPLKADYDMTAQHLHRYGQVVRCDAVLGSYEQRSNRGGCVTYRTPALMEQCAKYLLEKWPGTIHPHPTRGPGEVALRWKPPKEAR